MKAKVWNDNIYPHTESFKGEKVTIAPKGFILMDYDEAIEFRGQFTTIIRDADGSPSPKSYKMIRVEPLGDHLAAAEKPDPMKCIVCGFQAKSQADLASHYFEAHPNSLTEEGAEETVTALKKMQKGK